MLGKYILDENGAPVPEPDLLAWARWFESIDNRRVAFDNLGARGEVSTIFLGTDLNWDREDARPVLWETMVFGGPLDQEQFRYRSREEALGGHLLLVEQLRAWKDTPGAPEEKP